MCAYLETASMLSERESRTDAGLHTSETFALLPPVVEISPYSPSEEE